MLGHPWLNQIQTQMLAQGHTETEIAQILHVHVSTICRDVKVLKQISQSATSFLRSSI